MELNTQKSYTIKFKNSNGSKEWWFNGVQYSEEHFNKYQLKKKLQHTLEEKPQGKKVKI